MLATDRRKQQANTLRRYGFDSLATGIARNLIDAQTASIGVGLRAGGNPIADKKAEPVILCLWRLMVNRDRLFESMLLYCLSYELERFARMLIAELDARQSTNPQLLSED